MLLDLAHLAAFYVAMGIIVWVAYGHGQIVGFRKAQRLADEHLQEFERWPER